jgi:integrase
MTDDQGRAASRIDPKTGRQLPDGIRYRADRDSYQTRVRVQDGSGVWVERSSLFRTLADAKRAKSQLLVTDRKPKTGITLNQWHEKYWPAVESSVRPATARGYEIAWRKRVQPSLGTTRLRDITSTKIETAMVDWSGTASTRIDALTILSRLLNAARREGLIDHNAARDVRRPRIEKGSPASRALSRTEVTDLLAAIPDGHYRRFMAGLVFTGMRSGELTALRVRDVDFDRGIIHVRKSFSPGKRGELIEQTPKSHKERDVPLIGLLRPYAEEAANGKTLDRYLFDGPDGGRLTNRNVRRALNWASFRKTLGREDLRIHDMRYTLATLLFDAGVSAPDVQAILGHSSLQVTELYSRAREDAAQRGRAKLDDYFRAGEKTHLGPRHEL